MTPKTLTQDAASVLQAVDSPWPFAALVVLGFYVIAWKYGKELIGLVKETRNLAQAAGDTVTHVSESIVTNHGSKNIGDAVDRLTSWFMDAEKERSEDRQLILALADSFEKHCRDSEPIVALVHDLQRERLEKR